MHRITEVNPAARTGTCVICGPEAPVHANRGGWRCAQRGRRHNATGQRARRLRQRYDIGPEDYARLHAGQDGRCAVCGDESALRVDHSHTDGQVRGLLCDLCNRGLGLFRDRPELLDAASAYLRRQTL